MGDIIGPQVRSLAENEADISGFPLGTTIPRLSFAEFLMPIRTFRWDEPIKRNGTHILTFFLQLSRIDRASFFEAPLQGISMFWYF